MRVKWSARSLRDLESIRHYLKNEKKAPQAARRMVIRITKLVRLAMEQPEMGRSGRCVDTRELIVTGTPYIVAYRIVDNRLDVLSVLHSAKKWPDVL